MGRPRPLVGDNEGSPTREPITTRFLTDTDTAGDDVTSMLFGLLWPSVALEAVTVCCGNVYLEQATRNALYTVELAGRPEVPVYAGAPRPLVRDLVTAHYVHGTDGMGGANFPDPAPSLAEGHAAGAIIELSHRHAGELEIIAQAPLTNIALALLLDPGLPSRVRRLWVMGGSNNRLGNITPAAEFNFYVDPEAAHVVLAAGFELTLVPWDLCVDFGILLREELQPVLDMKTKLAEFYLQVNSGAWEFMRTHIEGASVDGISHPDSLMMAMAIEQNLILESRKCFVDVEYSSELTRGYSLVDLNHVLHKEPNATVVTRVDKDGFKKMLFELLRAS
ncbi:MAG TPA: nucleoside hydrolase [Actinomycetota bacterium]|nr:nucleoside hydrolase [Actinomycetota bacterium]